MNKEEEILDQYGLEPDLKYRDTIRSLLKEEINNEDAEDNEYLKTRFDNTIHYLMTIESKEANQEMNYLMERKDTDFSSLVNCSNIRQANSIVGCFQL